MRQTKIIQAVALLLGLAIMLTGCGASDKTASRTTEPSATTPAKPVGAAVTQPNTPPAAGQPTAPATELPAIAGDLSVLQAALGEATSIRFTIHLAVTPQGADKNAYLDAMLGEKGYPAKNELVLVVFPQDNNDIRFAMGSLFFEKKVSVEAMVDLVRSHYLPKARTGDAAGGLADLIRAVSQRLK